MKIIDLLNKIANGEEVPKFVNYYNMLEVDQLEIQLNSRVEGIEEPKEHKIPEKIDLSEWTEITSKEDLTYKTLQRIFNKNCSCFVNKINEIIDYLEKQNDNNSN